MRRIRLSWLLLGGMGVALWACGDSGSPTGMPPAGAVYGSGDDPYGSFNDPPSSDNEAPTSFNEGGNCGAEQKVSMSDVLLNVSLPICEFEASCSDLGGPIYPPDDGVPNQPNDATMHTLGLTGGFDEIPSFCLELAMSQSMDGQDLNECGLTKALGHVAKQFPSCEQHIVLPAGYCMATFARCVSDLTRGGCAAYVSGRYPSSCRGLMSSDDSSTEPQPAPGQPN